MAVPVPGDPDFRAFVLLGLEGAASGTRRREGPQLTCGLQLSGFRLRQAGSFQQMGGFCLGPPD